MLKPTKGQRLQYPKYWRRWKSLHNISIDLLNEINELGKLGISTTDLDAARDEVILYMNKLIDAIALGKAQ